MHATIQGVAAAAAKIWTSGVTLRGLRSACTQKTEAGDHLGHVHELQASLLQTVRASGNSTSLYRVLALLLPRSAGLVRHLTGSIFACT